MGFFGVFGKLVLRFLFVVSFEGGLGRFGGDIEDFGGGEVAFTRGGGWYCYDVD